MPEYKLGDIQAGDYVILDTSKSEPGIVRRSSMSKIYVVAGNMQQAKYWASEFRIPTRNIVYVSSPNVLRGTSDPVVAYVGTYAERKDLDKIYEMLKIARVGA